MLQGFRDLDSILRGDATRPEALRAEDGTGSQIRLPGVRMLDTLVLLGMGYGLCMGSYALFRTYLSPDETVVGVAGAWGQLFASMVKVPLLFVLTLIVTLPSLYVFNALCGSRLSLHAVVKLLLAMLGVILAVLAALGPIVAFFGLTSTSYAFMKLLNVAFCGAAGFIGLMFLLRTLHRLVTVQSRLDDEADGFRIEAETEAEPPAALPAPAEEPPADEAADGSDGPDGPDEEAEVKQAAAGLAVQPGAADVAAKADASGKPPKLSDAERAADAIRALRPTSTLGRTGDRTDGRAKTVFNCWLVLFGLVGAQMSWVLRPFIGDPDLPFTLFRDRQGNFFADVLGALVTLLGG